MRYRLLGRTGIRVSELCLGAMTFGEAWGWGAAKEESERVLETFAEAGGNFIDTANRYTDGESEHIVGELIAGDRERWVLSTKYAVSTRADDPNAGGTHRKNMVQALDASLKRLGTDYIDLYWVHIWDAFTPVEEVMRVLDDAVRAGKVLAVGISDTPAWLVAQANTIADLRGWTPFAGLQVPYSLVERSVERELLPMARALDLTVTTWGPLASGLLSGRYGTDRPRPTEGRLARHGGSGGPSERELAIVDTLNAVAEARGVSSAQAAIAWVRAQQHRGSIIPIVGARTAEQLAANLGVLDVRLTEEDLATLDGASRIEPGFPHEFGGRRLAYGDFFGRIDAPGLKIDA